MCKNHLPVLSFSNLFRIKGLFFFCLFVRHYWTEGHLGAICYSSGFCLPKSFFVLMFCIQNTLQETGLPEKKTLGPQSPICVSILLYEWNSSFELYCSLLHMHVCQVAAFSVVFFSNPCGGNMMRSGYGPDPIAAGGSDYWHWVLVWRSHNQDDILVSSR